MSYKLDLESLKAMIPIIENAARNDDSALCRVFALLGDQDIYMLFSNRQHQECLRFLQGEIGRELSAENVTFAGSLEVEDLESKKLWLLSGGSSLGRAYRNDSHVGQVVQTTIGVMLEQIGSEYTLR